MLSLQEITDRTATSHRSDAQATLEVTPDTNNVKAVDYRLFDANRNKKVGKVKIVPKARIELFTFRV